MTDLIQPIIFPKPYLDESPISYLIRVAEENSYKQVTWLYSQDAPSFRLSPDVLMTQLLKTEWAAFRAVSEEVRTICELSYSYLNISSMRFCPMCIKEEPYHRAKWYLKGSVACLDHCCWLVDKCPECHSTIDFKFMQSITHCNCGADLTRANVIKAPKGVIRYSRFLEGLQQIESENFEFRKAFDGSKYHLSYRAMIVQVLIRWCLSSNELFHYTGICKGLNSLSTAEEIISSFSDSWFSTAEDFEAYLIILHQKLCLNQGDGDELFRSFYKNLFKRLTHPQLQPIKASIQSYMSNHWIHSIDKRNSLFEMEFIDSHKWLALQAASRELDIPKSFLRQGVESGEIRSQVQEKDLRDYVLVHRDDVIKYNRLRSNYVNATNAASLLGVTKKQMNLLKESGLLTRNAKTSTSKPGQYRIDELQELVDVFTSNLLTVNRNLISLSEAIRKIGNGIKRPFITLLQAILSGEISAYIDSNYIGLRQIQIDSDELKEWYQAKVKESFEYYTKLTLRRHFQVSSDLIPQLVKNNLISGVLMQAKSTHKVFTVEAVNQFKERYVLLSKLSMCSFVSSTALMKKLESCEVFPVDHQWGLEERLVQKVYYRHDLLGIPEIQVLVSNMTDWEYDSY